MDTNCIIGIVLIVAGVIALPRLRAQERGPMKSNRMIREHLGEETPAELAEMRREEREVQARRDAFSDAWKNSREYWQ